MTAFWLSACRALYHNRLIDNWEIINFPAMQGFVSDAPSCEHTQSQAGMLPYLLNGSVRYERELFLFTTFWNRFYLSAGILNSQHIEDFVESYHILVSLGTNTAIPSASRPSLPESDAHSVSDPSRKVLPKATALIGTSQAVSFPMHVHFVEIFMASIGRFSFLIVMP